LGKIKKILHFLCSKESAEKVKERRNKDKENKAFKIIPKNLKLFLIKKYTFLSSTIK